VLNLGRTTFGFRVPAKTTTKISRLKVVANGVVLGGQPIELGPNRFDGYCSINDDRIVGWVAERSIEKKAPLITVINQDGKIIASKYSKFDLVFCDRFVNRAIFSIVVDCNMLPEELQNISILANGVPFFKIILAGVDKG